VTLAQKPAISSADDAGEKDLDAIVLAVRRDAAGGREDGHAVQRAPGNFGGQLALLRAGRKRADDDQGSKAAAYGIHGATAVVMLAIAMVLLLG
jgi:hypothetical protein